MSVCKVNQSGFVLLVVLIVLLLMDAMVLEAVGLVNIQIKSVHAFKRLVMRGSHLSK